MTRTKTISSARRAERRNRSPIAITMTVIFSLYCIIMLIPYAYAFLVSLQTRAEYIGSGAYKLFPFPKNLAEGIQNYAKAWTDLSTANANVPLMLLNSLWYSFGMVFIGLIYSSMGAYVVAKYKFFGRKLIHTIALIVMMLPVIGNMGSNLKFVNALGGYNSPLYVFIQAQSIGGMFIILYATFRGIDWGYAEAAFIDGAGHFSVFFRIMLPQIISPMCAIALSDFILFWADGETPLIFFPDLPTLASGLYEYQYVADKINYPVLYAGMMMCMIPTVVLFCIFQKNLMDIQLGGGLKG